jgi:hypothetical protein
MKYIKNSLALVCIGIRDFIMIYNVLFYKEMVMDIISLVEVVIV